jgi:hypothetical protein
MICCRSPAVACEFGGGDIDWRGRRYLKECGNEGAAFLFAGKEAKLEVSLDVKGLASECCMGQAAYHPPPEMYHM